MAVIYLPRDPRMPDLSGIGAALTQVALENRQNKRTTAALQSAVDQLPQSGGPLEGVHPTDQENPLVAALAAAKAGADPKFALQVGQVGQEYKLNQARLAAANASTDLTRAKIEQMPFEQALLEARTKAANAEVPLKERQLDLEELRLRTETERSAVLLPLEQQLKQLQISEIQETNPLKRAQIQADINEKNFAVEAKKKQLEFAGKIIDMLNIGGGQKEGATFKKSGMTTDELGQPTDQAGAMASDLHKAQNAPVTEGGGILDNASDADKLAIAVDLGAGNLPAAASHIAQAATPNVSIQKEKSGPAGSTEQTVQYTTNRAGQTSRKVLTSADTRTTAANVEDLQRGERGALQMNSAVEAMNSLITEAEKNGGQLGGPVKGRLQQTLLNLGINAGDKATALDSIQRQMFAMANEANKGNLSQRDFENFKNMFPKLSDSDSVKKAKLAAIDAFQNVVTKYNYERFEGSQFKPTSGFRELVRKKGLDTKDLGDLQKDFQDKLASISEKSPSSGGVTIGKETIPQADIDKMAKEAGVSSDEVVRILRKKRGEKE